MTEWLLKKKLGTMIPADPKTAEYLTALPHGAMVRAVITRPRNPGHHRLLWALLTKVVEAGAPFANAEALLFYLKVRTGHCDLVAGLKGHKYPMPRSISFAAMDQSAFSQFYEAVIKIIVSEVLPGVTEAELQEEIEHMLQEHA